MRYPIAQGGTGTPDAPFDWGDVPEADRNDWSRYFLDFLPWFPGAAVMAMLAPGVLAGGSLPHFVRTARELHAVGFTPTDYYLLCQDLAARDARGTLDPEQHGHLFRSWRGATAQFFVLDPAAWAQWTDLVRSGRSPRRATDHVLTGGNPPPMGSFRLVATPDGPAWEEAQSTLRTLGAVPPGSGEDIIEDGYVVGFTVGD